jgi:hypothetical protein
MGLIRDNPHLAEPPAEPYGAGVKERGNGPLPNRERTHENQA